MITLDEANFDLIALIEKREQCSEHSDWELLQFVWGDQAQIARYVSAKGREFGFTVRFKGLRAYELAALAASLDPQMVADVLARPKTEAHEPSKDFLSKRRETSTAVFANKLGHGRALGMGSVRVRIDGGLRWPRSVEAADEALDAQQLADMVDRHLLQRVDETVMYHWLRVSCVDPGRKVLPYLFKHEGKTMIRWTAAKRAEELKSTRGNPFPDVVQAEQAMQHQAQNAGRPERGRAPAGSNHWPRGGGHRR